MQETWQNNVIPSVIDDLASLGSERCHGFDLGLRVIFAWIDRVARS